MMVFFNKSTLGFRGQFFELFTLSQSGPLIKKFEKFLANLWLDVFDGGLLSWNVTKIHCACTRWSWFVKGRREMSLGHPLDVRRRTPRLKKKERMVCCMSDEKKAALRDGGGRAGETRRGGGGGGGGHEKQSWKKKTLKHVWSGNWGPTSGPCAAARWAPLEKGASQWAGSNVGHVTSRKPKTAGNRGLLTPVFRWSRREGKGTAAACAGEATPRVVQLPQRDCVVQTCVSRRRSHRTFHSNFFLSWEENFHSFVI